MRKAFSFPFALVLAIALAGIARAATVVPNEIQQPGTQPGEVSSLESPDKCDNCHGGYDPAVEPAFNWRGSMMANAGRDPIFWATVAIAEQDFDGAGDLCIRCHSTGGWYGGRSTPTDGSGLTAGDADGVDCDTCHKMTNPNAQELSGVMNAPFVANDAGSPPNGYYGSGMLSLSGGTAKLGPYSDAAARHQFTQSLFHRDITFCGSCHDVSNPAVGDLAHNSGAQDTADPVTASGVPGSALDTKAAFNNFPYQYGVVERTFSEYMSGALSRTLVADYASLPNDLKAGAIQAAYNRVGDNYADGSPRYFSCQTCHLPPVTGVGANKAGTPIRTDLPLHDMTGGNYWIPDAILYQNTNNLLRLGGGMTATQISAVNAGKVRAQQQLALAGSLSVNGNTLKVTNLTGHKLISGYPEGRRMWLNIKWYGTGGQLLREDGAYGPVQVTLDGLSRTVNTILDLDDPNTKIYEAHYGMTQEWAAQLIALGYSSDMLLSYDRASGLPDYTLGDLAAQAPGTSHESFHFVLNNTVTKDNRIPPFGFDYEQARRRNALPVPASQYRDGSGNYRYWDEFALNPPGGATYAQIGLMYQPTSWEYVQFLYLANDRQNAFLTDEGVNLLNAWTNTGMAAPMQIAAATWGVPVNTPTPTSTPTSTTIPPTATYTATSTSTSTPLPPTATFTATSTSTSTPISATATYTATATSTSTPIPPTATYTSTPTSTSLQPTATYTATSTATSTPIPATATHTATSTSTSTPISATATYTATATSTSTPIPPTATYTPTSTSTNTPVPATATYTATSTSTSTPLASTATYTATSTSTSTPISATATYTTTATSTSTPVPATATSTATNTPTYTPGGGTPTNTPSPTPTNTTIAATATTTATSTPTSTATAAPAPMDPIVAQVYPPDGAQACRRPQIGVRLLLTDLVRLPNGSFDASRVTLKLDGVNVTSLARISTSLSSPAISAEILYTPSSDLSLDGHTAQFIYPVSAGTNTRTWTFTATTIACPTTLSSPATQELSNGAPQAPAIPASTMQAPLSSQSPRPPATPSIYGGPLPCLPWGLTCPRTIIVKD